MALLPMAAGQIACEPGYAGLDERLVEAREGRDIAPCDRREVLLGSAPVRRGKAIATVSRGGHDLDAVGLERVEHKVERRVVGQTESRRHVVVEDPEAVVHGGIECENDLACGNPAQLAQAPRRVRPVVHRHERQGDVEGIVGEREALGRRTHGWHHCVPLADHDRRGLHGDDGPLASFVGTRAGSDVDDARRRTDGSPDLGFDAAVGLAERGVGAPDGVVVLGGRHHNTRSVTAVSSSRASSPSSST